MESATEQQTTRSWEQIRNLNSTGLFDDQLTYLRADEADLDTAKQNVERANQELDSAKDSHSETLKEFKASRHDVAVEIAELEVVDPVKRAIWANSFYLTEKVADPIRFGMEMEILVDQVGEKLSIGTPVLIQRPDGISISRIEVPGLVTNLSTEQAAPWDKSSNGKKISKGDIATNPVFTLSITTNNGPFLSKESFGHDEKPLTVKLWHDGDDNIARVRSNFIDEKFGIIIGMRALEVNNELIRGKRQEARSKIFLFASYFLLLISWFRDEFFINAAELFREFHGTNESHWVHLS